MRGSLIMFVALGVAAPLVAAAQDQPPTEGPTQELRSAAPEKADGWRFQFEPYAFLPVQTSGSVTVNGLNVKLDTGLGDLTDRMKFAGSGRFEAWNKRLGFILDATYTQSGATVTYPLVGAVSASSRGFVGDAMVGVRIATLRWGESSLGFQVMGGVRAQRQDVRISLLNIMLDASDWKARGVIGGQIPFRLSPRVSLMARGVVGVPDPYYTVLGGIEYDLSSQWVLDAMYRADWIRQSGDPDVNFSQHGPFLGVAYRFGVAPLY